MNDHELKLKNIRTVSIIQIFGSVPIFVILELYLKHHIY